MKMVVCTVCLETYFIYESDECDDICGVCFHSLASNQMTVAEIAYRLDDGEDVIDMTIEKWERIVELHKNNTDVTTYIGSSLCPLCVVNNFNCEDCPLSKKGYRCTRIHSPYDEYVRDRCVETAQNMVDALKQLKITETEEELGVDISPPDEHAYIANSPTSNSPCLHCGLPKSDHDITELGGLDNEKK